MIKLTRLNDNEVHVKASSIEMVADKWHSAYTTIMVSGIYVEVKESAFEVMCRMEEAAAQERVAACQHASEVNRAIRGQYGIE